MIVKQFNSAGISEFRNYLAKCRQNPELPLPLELLEDHRYTSGLTAVLEATPEKFVTKADAAIYLTQLLDPLPEADVAENAGLWTWLTLFFFDQVCPPVESQHVVKNDYHYIFEPKNSRHFYRHLLFVSWRALQLSQTHNRLILRSRLHILDSVTTEIMKRLFFTRIPCMFEVLDRLYWDDKKQAPRRSIVTPRTINAGDLRHRLPIRIRQLECTYDLQSLNADQLIELLGEEFLRPQVEEKKTKRAATP